VPRTQPLHRLGFSYQQTTTAAQQQETTLKTNHSNKNGQRNGFYNALFSCTTWEQVTKVAKKHGVASYQRKDNGTGLNGGLNIAKAK